MGVTTRRVQTGINMVSSANAAKEEKKYRHGNETKTQDQVGNKDPFNVSLRNLVQSGAIERLNSDASVRNNDRWRGNRTLGNGRRDVTRYQLSCAP